MVAPQDDPAVLLAHALERAFWIDCERIPYSGGPLEALETVCVSHDWRLLGILIWTRGVQGLWSAYPLGGVIVVPARPLPTDVEMITRLPGYPWMSRTGRLRIDIQLDPQSDATAVGARVLAWPQ